MVKKTYVAPSSNEASTKLRTGLLVGSLPAFGDQTNGNISVNPNKPADQNPDGTIADARRRSGASLD